MRKSVSGHYMVTGITKDFYWTNNKHIYVWLNQWEELWMINHCKLQSAYYVFYVLVLQKNIIKYLFIW
jgi:hypothetical protein